MLQNYTLIFQLVQLSLFIIIASSFSLIPPLVLVGNKGDLEFARKVSRQDGFHLSKKLRCEFFEASAREGWSKLLSPSSSPFMSFSSSSDYEVSNIFPAATETIRSKSPTSLFKLSSPKRRVSPNRSDKNKFVEKGKNEFSFNRYGKQSPRSVRRSGRSFSVAGSDTVSVPISHVSNTIPRLNSFPISSTFSEEDSDDTRPSTLSPPTGRKLSTHERLIGRLSPRLGRKLMKSNRTDECNNSAKDNNNNQNSGRSYDRLSFGFPNNKSDNKLKVISDEAPIPQITICCHSNSSSSANSIFGSTDSLLVIDHDKDDRVSDRYTANNPPLSPPEVFPESFNEHEFSSSEPFLLVCRSKQTQQRPRPRSRSPSHKIMNGLKKIRSLASDHTSGQGNNAVKHQNSTLMLPTFNH